MTATLWNGKDEAIAMRQRSRALAVPAWVRDWWAAAATAAALLIGGVLALTGNSELADWVWGAAVVATAVPLTVEVVRGLLARRGGVDIVAMMALVGAVLLGELLAGVVIAVMLTGGQALERYADSRSRRELTALLAGAPRRARRREGDELVEIDVDDVVPGDELVVGPGEVVPTDGTLVSERVVLDESSLTGESRPVQRDVGQRISSGAVNAGEALVLTATARAADSTYAGIVRLVEEAQANRAPFVRLADRAAGFFVPVTLAVAAGAWALSGDPVRALAVLVVATPCPLILAAPIAVTSGVSRMARRGMIVKGGGALEALAKAQQVLLDKTGTITAGRPRVRDVEVFADLDPDELLALAASLEQASAHVFAPAIVEAARKRNLALTIPSRVQEDAGTGVRGLVGDRRVHVGRATWTHDGPLPQPVRAVDRRAAVEGTSAVFVGVDGRSVGALILEDPLRPEAVRTVRQLRRQGVEQVTMLTGDHADVAALVGSAVDVDRVLSDRTPAGKVEAVAAARERGVTVMVGDGVNDAPALASAHVGVAMGARGATASSEAADVVIVVDRIDRLSEGLDIARRTQRIAWQSVQVGMGLSFVAMGFAAAGLLAPVAGAVVQELIDLGVIANALRALRGREAVPVPDALVHAGESMLAEHHELATGMAELRAVADRLHELESATARAQLRDMTAFLDRELLPHELAEEEQAYPLLAEAADGEDPTGPLRHTHREIVRLARLLTHTVEQLSDDGPDAADRVELRRLLYALHAIVQMHTAQEEEAFGAVGATQHALTPS